MTPAAAEVATLSPAADKLMHDATAAHAELVEAQNLVDRLLERRRLAVIKARAAGVSGYRLAQELGVSQTTIGNITSG